MPTTKKSSKTSDAKTGTTNKPARKTVPKRLGALDAAAQILTHAPPEGMNAKEMIDEMRAKGIWSSPAGKTPHATLAAGIVREINTKGDEARFRRVAPGRFALAQPGKKRRSRAARSKPATPESEPKAVRPSAPAPRKRRRAGAAK